MIIAVIPTLDEAGSIGPVVEGFSPHVDHVVVVDNGSRDRTGEVARAAGALVELEPRRGYGFACLSGIARAKALGAEVILFLDGDGSDDPSDAPRVLHDVLSGRSDLALGVRTPASIDPGAMTPIQRFGNRLAPLLMRATIGARYRDIPPLKAIRVDALDRLALRDVGHGFTIELLLKAHAHGVRVSEVAVHCRARSAGRSKVSGTLRGASRAGFKILTAIMLHALDQRLRLWGSHRPL